MRMQPVKTFLAVSIDKPIAACPFPVNEIEGEEPTGNIRLNRKIFVMMYNKYFSFFEICY
jgi:hypothetical protein